MLQPVPVNEADRLAALALYQVLDTPSEFAHDALTELAAQICNCPAAILSLIEERRQWFKSKYGLPADFSECPREITVCNTTICSNDLLYVPDLTRDPRFKDLPIVIGEPYLPASIAEELKAHDRVRPHYYEAATVMFADFKDFVHLTETLEPASLIEELNQNFARFDQIVEGNRLETLKTIGDAYMCVGGLPEPNRTHAIDACLAALQIQKFLRNANRQRERLHLAPWELRIGITTGSLVAGIVGTRRLTYDVWGNTANVSQRLQEACEPGRINISGSTFHQVAALFETEPRGRIEVKHMEPIEMYFLNRIRPDLAADAEGCLSNDRFWNASGR